jgi:hypothetical protein
VAVQVLGADDLRGFVPPPHPGLIQVHPYDGPVTWPPPLHLYEDGIVNLHHRFGP